MGLNNVLAPQFNLAIRNAICKSGNAKLTSPIDLIVDKKIINPEAAEKKTASNLPKQQGFIPQK